MIQRQDFTIRANGVIKGGNAFYSLDTDTGETTYQGVVFMPRFVPNKKIGPSVYRIDDVKLLSSLRNVGDSVVAGPLTFKVTQLVTERLMTDVYLNGENCGTATFDAAQEFLRLVFISVHIKVPILGMLTVEADAAPLTGFIKNIIQRFKCLFS